MSRPTLCGGTKEHAVETTPIRKYKSRIEGKNADVEIFQDRVEWSVTKTGRKRSHSAEMMPIRHVSSVTSKKDGLGHTKVVLVASGNTVEFRLPHGQAEEALGIIRRLLLGENVAPVAGPAALTGLAGRIQEKADAKVAELKAQQAAAELEHLPDPPAAAPPPPPPPAAAPPPSVPAGWHPDPMGRHELRYWDGGAWSEHVSTGGVQATDPPTPV